MIDVEPRAGTGTVEVTFSVAIHGLDLPVSVVGDFNAWDPSANPLTVWGNTYRTTVVLETGRRYAYRYVSAGEHWFNDETADDYQPNAFGGDDSILDLSRPRIPTSLRVPSRV